MSVDDQILTDTRDMLAVHDVFKKAFGDAPGQLASVSDGDAQRARYLADYLGEVLWLLHAHHAGEDEILFPLLSRRAPEERELFSRMEAQHAALLSSLQAAESAAERFGRSGSAVDGQALAGACKSLREALVEHLDQEEKDVLPIAARCVSPPEWGALPAHALSHYEGTRVWLPFGLVLEAMSDAMREDLLAHVPPPVSQMWFGGGSDAFAREMATIRGGTI
jgi:hemerythrin-like domain-containing protein